MYRVEEFDKCLESEVINLEFLREQCYRGNTYMKVVDVVMMTVCRYS